VLNGECVFLQRIIQAAVSSATRAGRSREAVSKEARREMEDALRKHEAAVLKEYSESPEHLRKAWGYFVAEYGECGVGWQRLVSLMRLWVAEASLDEEEEDDDDDDDEEEDEDDDRGHFDDEDEEADRPSSSASKFALARSVVRRGWRIKRAATQLLLSPDLLLEIMRTMGKECDRAVPEMFLRLQDELDTEEVASMPQQVKAREIMGRVQRLQPEVIKRGEARIIEEFGMSRTAVSSAMQRYSGTHPDLIEKANAALSGFQSSMQRELQMLVSSYGL
jgi:hypothetical protein